MSESHGATVIGQGMFIKGSVHSSHNLYMDAEIAGALEVGNFRLTTGPHGRALASASARACEVDIHGSITGNVECTGKIIIRASGRLTGDVRTAGIVIENRADFKGRVEIVSTAKP